MRDARPSASKSGTDETQVPIRVTASNLSTLRKHYLENFLETLSLHTSNLESFQGDKNREVVRVYLKKEPSIPSPTELRHPIGLGGGPIPETITSCIGSSAIPRNRARVKVAQYQNRMCPTVHFTKALSKELLKNSISSCI